MAPPKARPKTPADRLFAKEQLRALGCTEEQIERHLISLAEARAKSGIEVPTRKRRDYHPTI